MNPCICGCGRPQRTNDRWLSLDGRMFHSDACKERWQHGFEWLTCGCGQGFDQRDGYRTYATSTLNCADCHYAAVHVSQSVESDARASELREG